MKLKRTEHPVTDTTKGGIRERPEWARPLAQNVDAAQTSCRHSTPRVIGKSGARPHFNQHEVLDETT